MTEEIAISETPVAMQLAKGNGVEFTGLADLMEFAKVVANSVIVPKALKGDVGSVAAAMQMGAELGIAPVTSLQCIAVVNGIPSLYGDAALALVRASGLLEVYKAEYTDAEGDKKGCKVTVKRKGHDETSYEFTIGDAKRAGLWGKQGPWTQYPKRMLMFRARSFVLRDEFTDILKGYKLAEEVQDYNVGRGFDNARSVSSDTVAGTTIPKMDELEEGEVAQ